jgi:hypothetical protein
VRFKGEFGLVPVNDFSKNMDQNWSICIPQDSPLNPTFGQNLMFFINLMINYYQIVCKLHVSANILMKNHQDSPFNLTCGHNLMFFINLMINYGQTVPKLPVSINILMKTHQDLPFNPTFGQNLMFFINLMVNYLKLYLNFIFPSIFR